MRVVSSTMLQLITPIVTRCRAFMPVGVGLQVCIADPKGIAHVDKGRIAQIITNGLRFKHISPRSTPSAFV